jgi:diguanylate cyclase (GGDEF)-like protein
MKPVKILFLAANPSNSTRLALDEEAREITAKVRASKYGKAMVLETHWAVRPDDLLQALNEVLPNIVHFSGHGGGSSGLLLHSDSGSSASVSGSALERLFQTLKDNIRVVVLNACYSDEQAQSIVKVIDCVVGMQNSVDDRAAIKFAASFYRAIGFGRSVQNAFDQGISAIALENLAYEDVPKLLTHDGIDPSKIFLTEHDTYYDQPSVMGSFTYSDISAVKPQTQSLRKVRSLVRESEQEFDRLSSLDRVVGDHFLRELLPEIVKKAGSQLQKISLIMVDVDELTIINKQYRKGVGDEVLSAISKILQDESNAESSGRCGDDTFYIFLPGLDVSEASIAAENLRIYIQTYSWSSIARGLRVTCCFGVAQMSRNEPVRDWIIRAVSGLISAKDSGRNKTEVGPDYLSVKQSREFSDYYS